MLFWDSTKRYLAIGLLAAITIALCVAAFTKGRLWAVPVVTAAQAGAGSVNQPPAEPPIAAPPASSATSTAAPEPEVAVFLGDGFIQGIGGEGVTVVAAVALATDWRAVNLGLSGTGWSHATKTGGVDVCGREICPAIPEMVDEALSQHPTMIVISAGYNDRESIETVVVNTVQRIQQVAPEVRVVLVSPLYGAEQYPAALTQRGEELASAAAQTGAAYIDLGAPLANLPGLMSDAVYPNGQGYQKIAKELTPELRALVEQG